VRSILFASIVVVAGCSSAPQSGPTLETGSTDPAQAAADEPIADPVAEDPVADPAADPQPADAQPEAPTVCTPPPYCDDMPMLDSQTAHPIVLAHGMGGFDEFAGILEYWGGVQDALRADGFAVYTSVVDPLNGSDVRAKQLAEFVDRVLQCTCADKVNIIGHSQGGIDSRVLVNAYGYGDKVASVSTVATPHHGTPVADQIVAVPDDADQIINLLGWLVTEIYTDPKQDTAFRAAVLWCSSAHLAQFAADYPNDESVAWYSYAGRAGLTAKGVPECEGVDLPNPQKKAAISLPMLPGWALLGGLSGIDNDGLVTVDAAKWGHFRGCVPADHMQEIGLGLFQSFDHVAFYKMHAQYLADQGY